MEALVSFLANQIPTVLAEHGIHCEMDLPIEVSNTPVSARVREQLGFAVNEILANVIRHSGAKNVLFRIRWTARQLEIAIEDDGCGFKSTSTRAGGGNGISNLHQRMNSTGGTMRIVPGADEGTRVELEAPLD